MCLNFAYRLDYFSLDSRHVVSIARGPLHFALSSYQQAAWKHILSPISAPHTTSTTTNSPAKPAVSKGEGAEEESESSSHLTKEDSHLMGVEALCDMGHVMECDVPRINMCCACGSVN